MNQQAMDDLVKFLNQARNEADARPNQYVIAYYKQSDDSLLGYHLSSFCQIGKDILEAKRYSGEDPYSQLQSISDNIKFTLDDEITEDRMFYELLLSIREDFEGLKSKDIYMDAIYLAEGTPKRNFKYTII